MEYHGFISSLIERSEVLLREGRQDDLTVTRLLLIMNTGFMLVRDRIRYWDNGDDDRLGPHTSWKKLKKLSEKKLGAPILQDDVAYFERIRASGGWSYLELPEEHRPKPLSGHNIIRSLKNANPRERATLKLDHLTRALRNAFAHGGVLPMSPSQADGRPIKLERPVRDARDIDRVYFVSERQGTSCVDGKEDPTKNGLIILEFSVEALEAFWKDWCELILMPGKEAMDQLDQVG